MINESDPIMINGKAIKTAMEDGTHIVSPVFQEEHKLGRKRHDEYLRINIDIDNKKLLLGLEKLGFGDMRHMSADDKFKGVITALGELKSGTWKGRTPINPISTAGIQELRDRLHYQKFPQGLGSRDILKPYLDIADFVGVAPEDDITGEGKPRADRKKTPLQKEFAQFEQSPPIVFWRENYKKRKASYNSGLVHSLHTAMGLFDMSAEDFLKGLFGRKVFRKEGKTEEFIWIYPEGGKAANDIEWESWVEKLVGFTDKKFKTWMDSQGKTWNLIEFANDPDPDVYSGNNEMTQQGDKIRTDVSAQYSGGKGREKRLKEALKHFLVVHARISAGKYPDTSWFYIGAPELHYADLHMEDKEILGMYDCLKKPILNFTETKKMLHESADKFLRDKQRKTPHWGEKYRIIKTSGKKMPNPFYANQQKRLALQKTLEGKKVEIEWKTLEEDWDDAYHYFLYAVEIGWRANEAFTCGTSSEEEFREGKKKSAIWMIGDEVMMVKFLTRKTWGISERQNKDRWTTPVDVMDQRVIEAIQKRQAQVKAGLESGITNQAELQKKFKIRTTFTNQRGEQELNPIHSLIGYDGKYIGLGTMELQTSEDMTEEERKDLKARKQKPDMLKQKSEAQQKMRAIMRYCYQKVFPEKHNLEKYWTSNSLHSLRHVFAQAWLARSDMDFGWVANRGHWGGIAILEQAYGKPSKKKQLVKTMNYSKFSLADAEKRDSQKAEEKDASTGLNLDQKQMNELLAMIQKGMQTKFEVDKDYEAQHPEESAGAEKAGQAPEGESEIPKEKDIGVTEQ